MNLTQLLANDTFDQIIELRQHIAAQSKWIFYLNKIVETIRNNLIDNAKKLNIKPHIKKADEGKPFGYILDFYLQFADFTINLNNQVQERGGFEVIDENIKKYREMLNYFESPQFKRAKIVDDIIQHFLGEEYEPENLEQILNKHQNLESSQPSAITSTTADYNKKLTLTTNEIINLQSNAKNQELEIEKLKEQLAKKSEIIEQLESQAQKESSIGILNADAIQSYKKVKEIGHGDNGTVYEVIKGDLYVLKELNKRSIDSFRSFINEYEILSILHHPNVIKAYGMYLSDETTPPSIILEHCSQNIEDAIQKNSFSKQQIIYSIYQIAEGMKYIHFQKVIHRDLKPSNILITDDGTIKIGDFGISKIIEKDSDKESLTTGIGTLFFMAPEIINEEKYDEKVDVYSFGVLVYFILSGGEMPKIKIRDICCGNKASIPSEFNKFAKNLIESCWNFDPSQRPSFDEICNLFETNNYQLIDLDEISMKDALNLINQYKKHIPFYSK